MGKVGSRFRHTKLYRKLTYFCLFLFMIPVLAVSVWLFIVQKEYRVWIIPVTIAIFGIMFFLIHLVLKSLLRPFYNMLSDVRVVQQGELNVEVDGAGLDEVEELRIRMARMLDLIKELTDANLKHEILVKNTEIRALQNQINAHFIYNVLESIKMMAEIDEKYDISDAITALGKLLRYSMRWVSGNVTVADELEYIRNYLSLINLRVDYDIYLAVKVPELICRQEIPKMSLQPIVENAIYHGIEPMAEDTNIYIKGVVEGDDCIIEITDAGRGMNEDEINILYRRLKGEVETSGGSGNGIGLKNVQDRIRMSFGEKYGLEIASKPGCYTKVKVRIPRTYD